MIDYLGTLIIEQYGPVGLVLVYLHKQQKAIRRVVVGLAEEIPDVDADRVEERLQVKP